MASTDGGEGRSSREARVTNRSAQSLEAVAGFRGRRVRRRRLLLLLRRRHLISRAWRLLHWSFDRREGFGRLEFLAGDRPRLLGDRRRGFADRSNHSPIDARIEAVSGDDRNPCSDDVAVAAGKALGGNRTALLGQREDSGQA